MRFPTSTRSSILGLGLLLLLSSKKVAGQSLRLLSRNKPATQSSTYDQWFGGELDAARAVDGNLGTYSMTQSQQDPWLQVDLQAMNYITSITVVNRDAQQDRFSNAKFIFLDESGETVASQQTSGTIGDSKTFAIDSVSGNPVNARYVKLLLPGANRILHIKELEIKGPFPTESPTKSPTDSPTTSPTPMPSESPTNSPTASPTENPTSLPTNSPTASPTGSPTNSPTNPPSDSPTASPTRAISSWVVQHESTFANFNKTSGDEITLEYLIGKGREPRVTLFESGCEDPLDLDSDGITLGTAPATTDIADDPDHSKFEVYVNVAKNATVLGDLYADNILSFCVKVDLLNSDESKVIKYEKTDVAVTLDFENEFDIGNIILSQIFVGSDTLTTQVLEYVEACACNPTDESETCADSAKVITDGNDSRLKVCIKSTSPEMEIDYLDRLVLQADSFADDFVIVDVANRAEGKAYDGETAEVRKYADWNGVYAESVVPTSYFSYADDVNARVTGVVYLKLAGSSRRLAIDIELAGQHDKPDEAADATAGSSRALQSAAGASDQDQESAFVVNFELQKSDFELEMGDADVNGAAGASMSSGIVAAAGIIGSAAVYITTMMMW